jgi:hypothetical protein
METVEARIPDAKFGFRKERARIHAINNFLSDIYDVI